MYAITNVIGDLIDLGGWSAARVPLEVYRVSMDPCPALTIAKKWNIYLPPNRKDVVLELQEKCERRAAVPGVPVTPAKDMEQLMATITELTRRLETLEKERV